jgi:hypothetical protein
MYFAVYSPTLSDGTMFISLSLAIARHLAL